VRAMQTDDSGETEAFAAPGSDDLTLSFERYENGEATTSVTLEGVLGKDGLRAALEADNIEGFTQPDPLRDPFEGGDIVRGAARVGGDEGFPRVAVDGAGRSEAAEFLMFDSDGDEKDYDGASGGWIDAVQTPGHAQAPGAHLHTASWMDHIDGKVLPAKTSESEKLSDDVDASTSPAEDNGIGNAGHQDFDKIE